jgi:hypothetical protein
MIDQSKTCGEPCRTIENPKSESEDFTQRAGAGGSGDSVERQVAARRRNARNERSGDKNS